MQRKYKQQLKKQKQKQKQKKLENCEGKPLKTLCCHPKARGQPIKSNENQLKKIGSHQIPHGWTRKPLGNR